MSDPGRCNVAVTRAKEVFWIIGGDMKNRFLDSRPEPTNHMTKYKVQVDRAEQTHRF